MRPNRAALPTLALALLVLPMLPGAAATSQAGTVSVTLESQVLYSTGSGTMSEFTYVTDYGNCHYDSGSAQWIATGHADAHWAAPSFSGSASSFHGDPNYLRTETYTVVLTSSNAPSNPPCGFSGDLMDQAIAQADAQASYQTSNYMRSYNGPFSGTASATVNGAVVPGTSVAISGTVNFSATVGDPSWAFSMYNANVDGLCGCATVHGVST